MCSTALLVKDLLEAFTSLNDFGSLVVNLFLARLLGASLELSGVLGLRILGDICNALFLRELLGLLNALAEIGMVYVPTVGISSDHWTSSVGWNFCRNNIILILS